MSSCAAEGTRALEGAIGLTECTVHLGRCTTLRRGQGGQGETSPNRRGIPAAGVLGRARLPEDRASAPQRQLATGSGARSSLASAPFAKRAELRSALRWLGAAWVASAVIAGCAGSGARAAPGSTSGGGGVVANEFPTPRELDAVRERPQPELALTADVADVESWELGGPFANRLDASPYVGAGPWSQRLEAETSRRAGLVLPTEAMHCVARELGLFRLQFGAQPPENLTRFIIGRCSASVVRVEHGFFEAAVPERASDEEVFRKWESPVVEMIRRQLVGGARVVGIWFGRSGEQAVVIVASALRDVRLEPFSNVLPEDGRVAIRGEALAPAARIDAVIGRGRYGYAECEANAAVALPRFEFTCPADPDDASAWIDLTLQGPGRVVGSVGATLLVWPSGKPNAHYRRPSYVDELQAYDAATARAGIAELLNGVRRSAGLEPLELAAEQSVLATELAPHFFNSYIGAGDPMLADLIIMGLVAGWSIDGVIQSGNFAAARVAGTHDVGRLLSTTLERPSSRRTLLAPDVERIAIGAVLEVRDDVPRMAAIFGSYALFSAEAHDANARRVYELLEERRGQRGRRAPEILGELTPLAMAAAGQVQAGRDPTDVLGDLVQRGAEVLKRPVRGWMAEARELSAIEFPEEYLSERELAVAVGVSYRKVPDEPWGRFIVMIVSAAPPQRGA